MKTYSAKPHEIVPKWYVVDAADQTLGRLAVRIANILRGRHRPTYTPHVDTGDFVVVVNAARVRVTGNKADEMSYSRYSGYPGGLKVVPYRRMLATHPDRIVEHAVRGMVPHNRLGRAMMRKLKIYAGPEHPHAAQKPEPMPL